MADNFPTLLQHPEIIRMQNWPKQTELVEDGKKGDCWRCAISCVMDYPACRMPHFLEEALSGGRSMDALSQQWLNQKGWWLVTSADPLYCPRNFDDHIIPMPLVCSGPTVRSKKEGECHACVYVNDRLIYDPHPSGAGLLAKTDYALVLPMAPHWCNAQREWNKLLDKAVQERIDEIIKSPPVEIKYAATT
jgi:hypothetical protein